MYKSSSFTNFYKYIFPLFMVLITVHGIYNSWVVGTAISQFTAKILLVNFFWISFILVQMFLKLRNVEANDSGIYIKELKREIKYYEIEWIKRIDPLCPIFLTIKYKDKESGRNRKIAVMPKQGNQSDEMFRFVRDKIQKENYSYSTEKEPSFIKNIIIACLLGIPVFLLSLYFLSDFSNLS